VRCGRHLQELCACITENAFSCGSAVSVNSRSRPAPSSVPQNACGHLKRIFSGPELLNDLEAGSLPGLHGQQRAAGQAATKGQQLPALSPRHPRAHGQARIDRNCHPPG